jgi:hypothetical protein
MADISTILPSVSTIVLPTRTTNEPGDFGSPACIIADNTLHSLHFTPNGATQRRGMGAGNDFETFEIALQTLSQRVNADETFARELYGALCNMRWCRVGSDKEPVSMTWRYAGGVVAHLACRGGCYLDYYCAGGEGTVSERVRATLGELGWEPVPWPDL